MGQFEQGSQRCGSRDTTVIGKGNIVVTDPAASLADAFPERLRELVGGSSIRGFARKAGVSDTFLRQCLAGRTEPTRTKLMRLAAAGGRSLEWLATGLEPAPASADAAGLRDHAEGLDTELLQTVVETVEEVLREHGHDLTPRRKAALFGALYDRHRKDRRLDVSPEDILRLASKPS